MCEKPGWPGDRAEEGKEALQNQEAGERRAASMEELAVHTQPPKGRSESYYILEINFFFFFWQKVKTKPKQNGWGSEGWASIILEYLRIVYASRTTDVTGSETAP